MLTCSDCLNKICLIKGKGYGKPCKEIEALLPKPYTGRFGRNEHTFDPYTLEIIAGEQACKLKYGKRKEPTRDREA